MSPRVDKPEKTYPSRELLVLRVVRVQALCPSAKEDNTDPSEQLYVLWVVNRLLQIVSDICQLHHNLPVPAMSIEINRNGAHHLRPSTWKNGICDRGG